jgi:hypothetical protein
MERRRPRLAGLSAALLLQSDNVRIVSSQITIELAKIAFDAVQSATHVPKTGVQIGLNGTEARVVVEEANHDQERWNPDTEQQLKNSSYSRALLRPKPSAVFRVPVFACHFQQNTCR